MMDNMSLGDFSPKVMAAIIYSVVTLLAFSVFSMLAGAGNTLYLNTQEVCEVNGVRFDRVLIPPASGNTTHNSADTGIWANNLPVTEGTGGTCTIADSEISSTGDPKDAAGKDATNAVGTVKLYLPTGEIVNGTITSQAFGTDGSKFAFATGVGAPKWVDVEPMFTDNSTLVTLVIGALALLIGVSPMTTLGMLGFYILKKFDVGGNTISTIIMVVLGAVIAVTLLSTFVAFIGNAYDAIDQNRFVVFSNGLANLAVTIKQFWGVILIVSFFGLGAMLFKTWREGQNGSGSVGASADSRVLS